MVTSSVLLQLERPIAKSAKAVLDAVPGLKVTEWRHSAIAVAVEAMSLEEAENLCRDLATVPGVAGLEWMGCFFEDRVHAGSGGTIDCGKVVCA